MKSAFLRIFFIGSVLTLVAISNDAFAVDAFRVGDDARCYVHANGSNDEFWFCGQQENWCSKNWLGTKRKVNRNDSLHWKYHGGSFSYNGTKYWCCGGSTTKQGYFVEGKTWIDESKTQKFTEVVTGGKCTWKQKWNVCGEVDEAQSEKTCTEPEPAQGCATGYVARNGKCVPDCTGDMVFDANTNKCVECETTERQAIVKGECKKCELNEILDKKTLKCMTIQQIEAQKLRVSATAHDACWLCSSPTVLDKCLRYVTQNGSLNAELQEKCNLNSKAD